MPIINKYFLLTKSAAGDEIYYSTAPFTLPAIPKPKKKLETAVDFILDQAEIKKLETLKDSRAVGKIRTVPREPTSKTRNEVIEKRRRQVEEPQPRRRKRRAPTRRRLPIPEFVLHVHRPSLDQQGLVHPRAPRELAAVAAADQAVAAAAVAAAAADQGAVTDDRYNREKEDYSR